MAFVKKLLIQSKTILLMDYWEMLRNLNYEVKVILIGKSKNMYEKANMCVIVIG